MKEFKYTTINPNWKIKIAKRQDATGPYNVIGTSFSLNGLFGVGSDPLVDVDYTNSLTMFADVSSASGFPNTDASLETLALTRLKRKLKKQITSFDSLVPLAEIRDLRTTVKGLAELTTSLVKTLIDIKRTRGRSAFQYASKAWLTYGFGLRPMIADANALCKSIAAYLERSDRSVRLVGSATKDWLSTGANNFVTSNVLGGYNNRWSFHHVLSYRYIGLFDLPLKSSNNYGATDHFGFTFPDVLPALWEAAAFSWVVDYFTNVGEFLEDRFTSPPGDTVYVLKNRRYTVTGTAKAFHTPHKGLLSFGGDMVIDHFQFERNPLGTQLPHIGLRVRTVDEIGIFGVGKLLNLVSILGTGFKTRY
jgi:hypothetical protein